MGTKTMEATDSESGVKIDLQGHFYAALEATRKPALLCSGTEKLQESKTELSVA